MVREWKQKQYTVVTYIGRRDMVLEQLDTRLPCSVRIHCRRRAEVGHARGLAQWSEHQAVARKGQVRLL